MANYTGKVAVHETLTASTVDAVTLTDVGHGYGDGQHVTVFNQTGTSAIYGRVSGSGGGPVDPSVGGADCFVVPAAVTSVRLAVNPGTFNAPVVVKLVSSGAMAYSVVAV